MKPPEAVLPPFAIDPDVARAAIIDKRFYLDHDVWRLALERVFTRSWQWIGDLRDVATPLALSPRELLPGSLDEPLLLSRDGRRGRGAERAVRHPLTFLCRRAVFADARAWRASLPQAARGGARSKVGLG